MALVDLPRECEPFADVGDRSAVIDAEGCGELLDKDRRWSRRQHDPVGPEHRPGDDGEPTQPDSDSNSFAPTGGFC